MCFLSRIMVDLDSKIKGYEDLSPEQISAIRRTIRLGFTLQHDYPEVAELYKQGSTQREIVEILGLQLKYDVSRRIIENAVGRALVGHSEGFDVKSYEGLLPPEEREKLARAHRQECGIKSGALYGALGGKKLYEEGRGVHAFTREERKVVGRRGGNKLYTNRKGAHSMTSEELSDAGRRGGNISGLKNYQEKVGIHGRTSEQMNQDSLKGVVSRGCIPWSKDEAEYAYSLSQTSQYQCNNGANKGKSNNKKIAETLNNELHDGQLIRTPKSIEAKLFRYRESLEDNISD